ncbi:hypothetical protein J2S66_006222 [Saccharothrix longispora]|uniref:Uncharacterized protein n=1 Tax=Saccharothrix longispora TaxID=33920 RepID=A0ABU1Q5P3_9PSEU|nr:hypothetical protein [Saccharothrix longispora]
MVVTGDGPEQVVEHFRRALDRLRAEAPLS